MNSSIKLINDFDNNKKEIVITKLYSNPNSIEMHKKQFAHYFVNDTEEERDKKIKNLILRENAFNSVMEELSKNFEFTFDESEVAKAEVSIAKNFENAGQKINDIQTKEIAKKAIMKTLIYSFIENKYKIVINDEQVKTSLNQFYLKTNESIRKYLNDKSEFEKIRNMLKEEEIVKSIFNIYKIKFDLKNQSK